MNKKGYGKSNHYIGVQGDKYFQYQNIGGFERGVIESRKFLPYINEDDSVMDLGCGGGHLLAALKCRQKVGIEINPTARQEASKYGYFIFKDISQVGKESIDKVISNHTLEHVLDPIKTLNKIRECLKTNGKLILCLPIDDWRTERNYRPNDINHHLYTWTPQLIGNCLSEAGFHIDAIKIYTHAWPPKVFFLNKILPLWIFDIVCTLWSILRKRRQIIALASRLE